jgi:hypothetical protein
MYPAPQPDEYKLDLKMRPKLLLSRLDADLLAYLRELKAPELLCAHDEQINIVAVTIEEQPPARYINGFIFTQETPAIGFYHAVNCALGFQLYLQRNGGVLPFNHRMPRLIGAALNGGAVVDPLDFLEGREEEEEVKLLLGVLEDIKEESLYDFSSEVGGFRMALRFTIVDDQSLDYAYRFLTPLAGRIQHLVLNRCELSNSMLGKLVDNEKQQLLEALLSLQSLDLSSNRLTDEALTILGSLFRHCRTLHRIDLGSNHISLANEGILHAFLLSVGAYKLELNLANNQISNAAIIAKYFVAAEGSLPVATLDVSANRFKTEELGLLARAYLDAKKEREHYQLELKIGEMEFEDTAGFELLTKQHRQSQPTALSVPLLMTKIFETRLGDRNAMAESKLRQAETVDYLLKRYEAEAIVGNFYARKKIKGELVAMGVDPEVMLENEPVEIKVARMEQEQFVCQKLEAVFNYQLDGSRVVADINAVLKMGRRRGLEGSAIDSLAFLKHRLELLLEAWAREGHFGRICQQVLLKAPKRYRSAHQEAKRTGSPLLGIDYRSLTEIDEAQLLNILNSEADSPEP